MKRKLQVCMLGYYFPPVYAGGGLQALRLANTLKDFCDVFILTPRHDDSPQTEDFDGVRIFRLRCPGTGHLFAFVFAVRLAWRLFRWRNRYDLVHAHGYPLFYFLPLCVLRLLRKPNIQKITMAGHDDPASLFDGRLGWLRHLTDRWICVKIAPSTAVARLAVQASDPAAVGRVAQIPNGVDTGQFRPGSTAERSAERARLGLASDTPVALYVGAVTQRKGVDDLLRAWVKVAAQLPAAQLLIAGPLEFIEHGGRTQLLAGAPDFPAMARELGIAESVRFLGEQMDVPGLMQCSDVFCLATKREGMPNVLLEAAASGLPAVAYVAEGVEDIIVNGETGFCVPAGAVDALAETIVAVLADASRRARMQAASRRRAEQKFSLDLVAQRYLELYRDLLKHP